MSQPLPIPAAADPVTISLALSAPLSSSYYQPGVPNACPGCGVSQWWVGRRVAECAHCAAALPIGHFPAGRSIPLVSDEPSGWAAWLASIDAARSALRRCRISLAV